MSITWIRGEYEIDGAGSLVSGQIWVGLAQDGKLLASGRREVPAQFEDFGRFIAQVYRAARRMPVIERGGQPCYRHLEISLAPLTGQRHRALARAAKAAHSGTVS